MAGYEVIHNGVREQEKEEKRRAIIEQEGTCPVCGRIAKHETVFAPATRIPAEAIKDAMAGNYDNYERKCKNLLKRLSSIDGHLETVRRNQEPYLIDMIINYIFSGTGEKVRIVVEQKASLFSLLMNIMDSIKDKVQFLSGNSDSKVYHLEDCLEYLKENNLITSEEISVWYYAQAYDWIAGNFEHIHGYYETTNYNFKYELEKNLNAWRRESLPKFYAKSRTQKMGEDAVYRNEYICDGCSRSWYGNAYTKDWNLATDGLVSETIYDMSKYPEISQMEGICPECGETHCNGKIQHQVASREADEEHYLTGEIRIKYNCKKCGTIWWGNYYDHELNLI